MRFRKTRASQIPLLRFVLASGTLFGIVGAAFAAPQTDALGANAADANVTIVNAESANGEHPEADKNGAWPARPRKDAPGNESAQRNENRQRMQERQQRLEQQMRHAMGSLGFSDVAIQDAVINYIAADIRERRPIVAQGRRLFAALRSQNVPDARLSAQVREFRAAVEAEKQRRLSSEAALDARLKYSQNPRLEAMLLILGVIGDNPVQAALRDGGPNIPPGGGRPNGVPRPDGLRPGDERPNDGPPRDRAPRDVPYENEKLNNVSAGPATP